MEKSSQQQSIAINQNEFMNNDENLISALQPVRATFEALQIRYFVVGVR
jgi:hypothetical protein